MFLPALLVMRQGMSEFSASRAASVRSNYLIVTGGFLVVFFVQSNKSSSVVASILSKTIAREQKGGG